MPAEAAAGLAEAIVALFEMMVLMIELIFELLFLLVELVCWIFGRRSRIARPEWIQRRRERGRAVWIKFGAIGLAALVWAGFHYGQTHIHFRQNGFFSTPDGVQVVLSKGDKVKAVTIEKGKLRVLRGHWDRVQIADSRYVSATHAISGHEMHLRLEKLPGEENKIVATVEEKAKGFLARKLLERDQKKADNAKKEEEKP